MQYFVKMFMFGMLIYRFYHVFRIHVSQIVAAYVKNNAKIRYIYIVLDIMKDTFSNTQKYVNTK